MNVRRPRSLKFVAAVTTALGILLTGCTSAPSSDEQRKPQPTLVATKASENGAMSAERVSGLDNKIAPCRLLTPAQLNKTLNAAYGKGKEMSQGSLALAVDLNTYPQRRCTFQDVLTGNKVTVIVKIGKPTTNCGSRDCTQVDFAKMSTIYRNTVKFTLNTATEDTVTGAEWASMTLPATSHGACLTCKTSPIVDYFIATKKVNYLLTVEVMGATPEQALKVMKRVANNDEVHNATS